MANKKMLRELSDYYTYNIDSNNVKDFKNILGIIEKNLQPIHKKDCQRELSIIKFIVNKNLNLKSK